MAFKILDKEEISLLTDKQRIEYEKEFDLYQQRLAFVEHLEMIENANIEPYKPKLKSISVINEIEMKPFEKKDYAMLMCNPTIKVDLNIKSYKKAEQIAPTLPLVSKCAGVQTKHIKKIERIQPDLPKIIEPEVKVTSFKHEEKKQANLPITICPIIKTTIPFEQLKNNLHYIPSSIPDIVMPDIDIKPITVPVNNQPIIPEVSVISYKTKAEFHKPEQKINELPTVSKPNVNIRAFIKAKESPLNLPKILDINMRPKKFNKPEQVRIELPTAVKTNVAARTYKRPKKIQANITVPLVPSVEIKTFTRTKGNIPSLPRVNIGEVPDVYLKLKNNLYAEWKC